ncbi:MAG: hypothetical protein ACRDO2_05940 [Nocardioidaceae bacterium]
MAVSAMSAGMITAVAVTPPSTGVSPFFVRVAQLVLAGGAAYLIDDGASAVTAAVPRSFWRRRAAALWWGVGAMSASWAGIVALVRSQSAGFPMLALTLEVAVLCMLGFAAAAVLRWRGDPEPGSIVAPAVMLLGLAALIGEHVLRIAIFVFHGGVVDTSRETAWVGAGLLSLLVILGAARDPAHR